jgi:hypothetical protein
VISAQPQVMLGARKGLPIRHAKVPYAAHVFAAYDVDARGTYKRFESALSLIGGTMSNAITLRRFTALAYLCVALTLTLPLASWADESPPQVTKEGLELKKQTKQRIVYLRPGATFEQYKKVAILDCYVEFSKSWMKDYNSSVRDPSRKITDSDLERAKKDLSEQFKKIFSEELTEAGFQMTDSGGPDVLILRPALVNIEVSAPDLMSPGRSATYVQSAGQMTLFLELFDGGTNMIVARVMDAQADPNVYGQRTSSVTNRAAADRILSDWARELVKKLKLAEGKS